VGKYLTPYPGTVPESSTPLPSIEKVFYFQQSLTIAKAQVHPALKGGVLFFVYGPYDGFRMVMIFGWNGRSNCSSRNTLLKKPIFIDDVVCRERIDNFTGISGI